MSRYAKGYKTKQKIIDTGKRLFYEYGYANTAVKEICEIANVKLGTFTYYFKTKDNLVKDIYAGLLIHTYRFVELQLGHNIDSIQKNVAAMTIYYKIIFDDPKNVRFHHEVLEKKSVYGFMVRSMNRVHRQFIKDLNLSIDEVELKCIASADLGFRREISLDVIEKKLELSPIELANAIHSIMGRMFKMDSALMDRYIEVAGRAVKSFDYSGIKFLV